jgi:hypothetical protein
VISGTSSPIGRPKSGNSGVGAGAAAIETDPAAGEPTGLGSGDERLNPASTSARSASGCGVFSELGRIERSRSAGGALSEKS